MLHPWHEIAIGRAIPETFPAYIEIPAQSNIKYELDKEFGVLKVDRILYGSIVYPANYGFIPQTFADDDDPLDVLVLCQASIAPGTLIYCKPIGALQMVDGGKQDTKIIAVPTQDPAFTEYKNTGELPIFLKAQLKQFFKSYKELENKEVIVEDYESPERAKEIILATHRRYAEKFFSANLFDNLTRQKAD